MSLSLNGSTWSVGNAADGSDTLHNIERLTFTDTGLALDVAGHAGSTVKVIGALFGISFLSNRDFVGIGLQLLDGDMPYADLVGLALGTDLFAPLAGSRPDTDFVKSAAGRNTRATALNHDLRE